MADVLRTIRRGEIWWADLEPVRGSEQGGRRPVLVLSNDVFNARSGTVIAVAITSQEPRAGFPLTLELTGAGLPRRSWAKLGQVRTLSTPRIDTKAGEVSDEQMLTALEGLFDILGP